MSDHTSLERHRDRWGIIIVLLVVVKVLLVLVSHTYPPRKLILEDIGMIFFVHIRVIPQYPMWHHI